MGIILLFHGPLEQQLTTCLFCCQWVPSNQNIMGFIKASRQKRQKPASSSSSTPINQKMGCISQYSLSLPRNKPGGGSFLWTLWSTVQGGGTILNVCHRFPTCFYIPGLMFTWVGFRSFLTHIWTSHRENSSHIVALVFLWGEGGSGASYSMLWLVSLQFFHLCLHLMLWYKPNSQMVSKCCIQNL